MAPKSIEHCSSAGDNTSIINANNTSMNHVNKGKYLDLDFYKSHGLSSDYTMISEYPIATLKSKTIEEFLQIGLEISTIKDLRKILAESETPIPTHHRRGSIPQNLNSNGAATSSLRDITTTTNTTAIKTITTTTTTTNYPSTTTVIASSPTDNTISSSMPCKVVVTELNLATSSLKDKAATTITTTTKTAINYPNTSTVQASSPSDNTISSSMPCKIAVEDIDVDTSSLQEKVARTISNATTSIASSPTDNTISPSMPCKVAVADLDVATSSLQDNAAKTITTKSTTTTSSKTTVITSSPTDNTVSSRMPCKVAVADLDVATSSLRDTDPITSTTATTTFIASTTTVYLSLTDNTISPSMPVKEAVTESDNASAVKPHSYRKNDHPDLMMKFSFKNIKGFGSKKKREDFTDISENLVRVFEFANSEIDEKIADDSEMETNRIINYWPLDEDELKEQFIAGACTECHNLPSALGRMKTCSQCCLVWYCGRECQKKNWKYHKEFCKVTKAVAKDFNNSYIMEGSKEAVSSGMGFVEYFASRTYNVAERLKCDLNRDLDALEASTLLNPKVCEICKDADPTVLKPCEICCMVFYCSKDHSHQDSVRHAKICPAYLLALQCYQLITTKGLPIPRLHYKMATVSEYKPLTGTMKDYIRPIFDAVDTFVSEFVSYPLSLIYALEHTGLRNGTKQVSEMKELTVLMCDPCNGTHKTMCHNFMWEYMFHLLPNLKKLTIILCELTPQPQCGHVSYEPCKPLDEIMCSDCKSKCCNFSVHSIDDYHKYKLSNNFKKPDVIFNHIATDRNHTEILPDIPPADWDVPLILVDSKDMIQDSLKTLRRKEKLNILLPLQLNPYSGIQPTKCYDGSLVYTNSYIVGVRRQNKRNYRTINYRTFHGQTIGSMLGIPGFLSNY